MPVPNGPTPTMSGPMTISTMQFEPIDTISGFTTFIVHHGGPTATSSSVPASITASASVSASASASTSATPGLPFKLPGIQLPTIQRKCFLDCKNLCFMMLTRICAARYDDPQSHGCRHENWGHRRSLNSELQVGTGSQPNSDLCRRHRGHQRTRCDDDGAGRPGGGHSCTS